MREELSAWQETTTEDCAEEAPSFEISVTKVIPMQPVHLAFRRHVGPYESVPESLFDDLEAWAARRGMPGPPVWMGIGHELAKGKAVEKILRK